MKQFAGWATDEVEGDVVAHQVQVVSTDPSGRAAYRSLCGRITSSQDWTPAGPEVTRCPECQDQAAGSPD